MEIDIILIGCYKTSLTSIADGSAIGVPFRASQLPQRGRWWEWTGHTGRGGTRLLFHVSPAT